MSFACQGAAAPLTNLGVREPTLSKQYRTLLPALAQRSALSWKVDKDETMTSQNVVNINRKGESFLLLLKKVSNSLLFISYHCFPLMNVSLVEKCKRSENSVLSIVCEIS